MKYKVYTSRQLSNEELKSLRASKLVATYKHGGSTFHLVVD